MMLQPPNATRLGAAMSLNGVPMNGATGMPMNKMQPGGLMNGSAELDQDLESRKRKMQEVVESEAKRARQKTGTSM